MMHKLFLPWCVLFAIVGPLAIGASAQEAKPRRPPNVIIVNVDDMGYADLGCFGAKKIKTPNLDRMAKQGVRFTSFYVAQAVCSASRAALMTGKYSNRTGILGALGPASKQGLGPNNVTMAQMLRTVGYVTSIIGKWHLGHLPENLPTRHGFDEYYGLPYSNDMWPKHPTAKFPDLPLIEGEKTIALNPDQTRLTTDYTERAVRASSRRTRIGRSSCIWPIACRMCRCSSRTGSKGSPSKDCTATSSWSLTGRSAKFWTRCASLSWTTTRW